MSGQNRNDIRQGMAVDVVLKKDQGSGLLTRGIVADILTPSQFHPRGIKVRLSNGLVGRVQKIIAEKVKSKNVPSGTVIFQADR